MLLNYDSLKADRGKGLRDPRHPVFLEMSSCSSHIAKASPRTEPRAKTAHYEVIELNTIRGLLRRRRFAWPRRRVLQGGRGLPTLFLFSPYEDGNESWLTREQMVTMLEPEPIEDSRDIFKTVLNDEDKIAFDGICTNLVACEEQLRELAYVDVSDTLRHIASLRMVGSGFVSNLLAQSVSKIQTVVDVKKSQMMTDLSAGHFDAAAAALDDLDAMRRGVAKAGDTAADIVARLDAALVEGKKMLEKRMKDSEETDRLGRVRGGGETSGERGGEERAVARSDEQDGGGEA